MHEASDFNLIDNTQACLCKPALLPILCSLLHCFVLLFFFFLLHVLPYIVYLFLILSVQYLSPLLKCKLQEKDLKQCLAHSRYSGDTRWIELKRMAASCLFIYLAVSGLSCSMLDLLLWCTDSLVVVGWLTSCSAPCRILVPGPGIEPKSPALQSRFLTTGPQRKSCYNVF